MGRSIIHAEMFLDAKERLLTLRQDSARGCAVFQPIKPGLLGNDPGKQQTGDYHETNAL